MRQVTQSHSVVTHRLTNELYNPTMSVQTTEYDSTEQHMNESDDDFALAPNASALVKWLDEQPNFITVERERTLYRAKERYIRTRRRKIGTKTVEESVWLNPDYEVDTRACYGSQDEVCTAWAEMKFPAHRMETVDGVSGAYLYTWSSTSQPRARFGRFRRDGNDDSESTINYEAVQHPSGHGVIMHYDTLAAVRTKSGLVLTNEQDFGTGFAHITHPESDHELPLSGVSNVLSGESETVYDIVSVTRDQTRIRYTTADDPIGGHSVVTGVREARDNDRQVTRLELSSGAAVVLLHDSTANDPDEEKCGFYLPPEEAAIYEGAQGALDSLQPIDVLQARERGMDVVPSDRYAGNGAHGFYDEDLLGDAIIRQGEWYLIPMPEDWEPEGVPVYKPLPKARRNSRWDLDNVETPDEYDVTAFDHVSDSLPTECVDCGAGGLEVTAKTPVVDCPSCGTKVCYDEQTFEEIAQEGIEDWVDQRFKEDYREALDTLDSHRPRDLAVTDDGVFVRGSFRHQRNEHRMLNLKERWHLVAENTRDVVVFDLGTDGTGGIARWE